MRTESNTNSIACDGGHSTMDRGSDKSPEGAWEGAPGLPLRVAYIMSRFPKITETFILYEIREMEHCGVEVEIYPLLRERAPLMHPEAAALTERAHFYPFLSWAVARSHLYYLWRQPRVYLNTLGTLVRTNWGSYKYFTRALALFPKAVHFAYEMAREGISHVHAHFASHPSAAAFVIGRLTGIPYSFTAHGHDVHCDLHMLREKVAEARFVVPISDYNKELIVQECGAESRQKLAVIHCGVDTEVFHPPSDTASNGKDCLRFSVFCIGSLYEVKGQTYVIEACRRLRDHGVSVDCHFVGDGPDQSRLARQAIDSGLAERVHFHGWRKREEIAELLQHASVVVAPSVPTADGKREGIPVALMEAMASGVPVVASNISGIPELVVHDQTGFLVPPRDPDALAAGLERLHRNPSLRRRLGQAGRHRVVQDFNLSRNAALLAQQFRTEES